MRRSLPVLALLALGLAGALDRVAPSRTALAGYSESLAGCKGLLRDLVPRQGPSHRWLAVVALVLPGAPRFQEPAMPEGGLSWLPAPRAGAPNLVAVHPPVVAAGVPAVPRLLPSGVCLRRGADERITLHPTLLPDGEPVVVDTLPVASIVPSPPVAADPRGEVGRLPPVEFRHTAFSTPDGRLLRDLLALDGILLGLHPEKEHVSLASLAGGMSDRATPTIAALRSLPTAYGGDVVGHVAFLGNRAVEVVVTPAPAIYRSILAAEERALALSLVGWEELYGREGPLVPEPDWDAMRTETTRLLATLAEPSLRPVRRDEPRPTAGEIWRVKATVRPGRAGTEVGWLLGDPTGRAFLLEAWMDGAPGPLPPPARTPGGKPVDEDPNDRKQGAMTRFFLERLRERQEELRGG